VEWAGVRCVWCGGLVVGVWFVGVVVVVVEVMVVVVEVAKIAKQEMSRIAL